MHSVVVVVVAFVIVVVFVAFVVVVVVVFIFAPRVSPTDRPTVIVFSPRKFRIMKPLTFVCREYMLESNFIMFNVNVKFYYVQCQCFKEQRDLMS